MTTATLSYELAKTVSGVPGYDPFATAGDTWFDEDRAGFALDFFGECLTFTKGEHARKPFKLEPWQQAIVANLWGWYRPDGTRRYREAFIFLPRKNGKTEIAAGLVNLCLFTDDEPRPEVYSAAAEREQARLVFDAVRVMIEQDEHLYSRAELFKYSIVVGSGSYKAISADAHTKHGFNTHLAIIDELHAQPNRDLVDVITTSMGARRQPLLVHITTSDFDREGSICNEKYDYACKVRDGVIEDASFLPVIYEATRDDDWTAEATWRKANPNLGVSVSVDFLARECQRAQDSPAYENTFKRLHLNIRTEQDVRWVQLDRWDACCGTLTPQEIEAEHRGHSCWAGLDLSTTTDLSALALVFRSDTGFDVVCRFWVPAEGARKRGQRDRVPYEQWIKEGWITATEGDVIDYDVIRRDINELGKLYHIEEIAADRWNASGIIKDLGDDGFTIFPFGQGYASMSFPAKEVEKLVIGGTLAHGGNPVLRWMASNVSVEQDAAGNIKPSKKKSTERIDGIVALCMAVGRASVTEGPSVYRRRGLVKI